MGYIRKNITLIIGIAIPVLMIIFVAVSIYLPGIFIEPKSNFLYISGNDDYNSTYKYTIQNKKLTRSELPITKNSPRVLKEVKIYIHDIATNKSKEISFGEAQELNLNSNLVSPDGFKIVHGGRSDGFFPFFIWSETDYSTFYVQGRSISKKLNLILTSLSYDNFRFIGWIE